MGNALKGEHVTGLMMLRAIEENSEEKAKYAWEVARKERVVSREEMETNKPSVEEVKQRQDEALLMYGERTYNAEKKYFRAAFNKMTFVEFAFSIGHSSLARTIQRLINAHRVSMGLEVDAVLLSKKSGVGLKGTGKEGLSSEGVEAKGKLKAFLTAPRP